MNEQKSFVRVAPYLKFVEISRDSLKRALELEISYQKIIQKGLEVKSEDERTVWLFEEFLPIQSELHTACITTIIFAALAVEGYIYDYAARNLSDTYVQKHLDKLDLISKWIIIPKLIRGKEFPKGGLAYRLLDGLVKNRNYIVHNKSTPHVGYDETDKEFLETRAALKHRNFSTALSSYAKEAIHTIDALAIELGKLDPNESAEFFLQVHRE